jgi:hypothetical protein
MAGRGWKKHTHIGGQVVAYAYNSHCAIYSKDAKCEFKGLMPH